MSEAKTPDANGPAAMNRYLAVEFGLADPERAQREASQSWPFTLEVVGALQAGDDEHVIYRFEDGEDAYFVFSGPTQNVVPSGGLDLDELQQLWAGSAWLYDHDVVELSETRPVEDGIPSCKDRYARLNELLADATTGRTATLRVGVYLAKTGDYVGLAELDAEGERSLLFGTSLPPREVCKPGLSPHRRMAFALGGLPHVQGSA